MIQLNIPQPEEKKSLIIGMHLFAIIWMISFQILMIVGGGSTISVKGCIIFLLQIVTYLFCQLWVISKAFNKNTQAVFFFRLLLLISGYILIRGLVINHKKNFIDFLNFLLSFEQFTYALVHLTILIGLNFFLGLYRRNEQLRQNYLKAIKAALEAETEKAKIESIVTQMRLSPHLMFNTLNYIQQKADGIIPEIVRAVDLFSGIVRHSMTDILKVNTVLLSKEIERIKDQIELHKQLADGRVHINFEEEYNQAIEDATIPPATLLTFVENVFRYGLVKDPDYPPSINIKIVGREFTFSTWNYKRADPHHGTGMGIKSVASTLGYYYSGLHTLHIENLDDTFQLTLTIQL